MGNMIFFAYRKRTLSSEIQLITSLQILTSLDSFMLLSKFISAFLVALIICLP